MTIMNSNMNNFNGHIYIYINLFILSALVSCLSMFFFILKMNRYINYRLVHRYTVINPITIKYSPDKVKPIIIIIKYGLGEDGLFH